MLTKSLRLCKVEGAWGLGFYDLIYSRALRVKHFGAWGVGLGFRASGMQILSYPVNSRKQLEHKSRMPQATLHLFEVLG